MPDDDADAVVQDRVERVLVGQVVADVDRQQRLLPGDLVEDPFQGLALVPVQVRAEFDHHPARCDPQATARADLVHLRRHPRGGLRRGVAVVHRDREPLVLHHDSGDVECLGELGRGPLQHRHRRRRGLVLVMAAVRADHLEPVAARVPQAGNADAAVDVGEIAAGEDGDRVKRGQRLQRLVSARDQGGRGGVVDDLRQGAVEVEEQHRPSRRDHTGQQAERQQGVGQLRHPAVDGADGDVGELADHDVGAALQQPLPFGAAAVHADDQTEPAGTARGHPRLGVLDDDAAAGPDTESSRGFQQCRGIRLAGQPEFLGDHPVDPDLEQVTDTGRLQDGRTVAARRVHRGAHTDLVEPADQGHGGPESRYARGDLLEEQALLAVAEPAHGVLAPVRLRSPRQRDAAGGQEVPDAVIAGFTVHVMLVVVGGERVVILPVRRRSTVQEVVEQLRPGRLVQ